MSQILKQVSENNWPPQDGANNQVTLSSLLADLTTRFCSGSRWMLRQSYVNICNQLVTDRALPLEDFAKLLLSPLLALRQDRVPNVRLVLARVINFQLKYHGILIIDYFQTQLFIIFLCLFIFAEFFAGSDSPYRESLDQTLNQLSADEDRDVSYFATANREDLSMTTSIVIDESQA